MDFPVSQACFSGPFCILLARIEEKHLDITAVSLAAVAEDFLVYLETHTVPTDELADFLIVASRLLYLKSRELVPVITTLEDEKDATILVEQLRVYQVFAHAAERLAELFDAPSLVVRSAPSVPRCTCFVAPEGVSPDDLATTYRTVLARLAPFLAPSETAMERVKSIEECISELRVVLFERPRCTFFEISRTLPRKVDIVVSFLALLELLRENAVTVVQHAPWEDMLIYGVRT